MRILYVILTCEKYLNSRCQWQIKTWINNINEFSDYVFLSSENKTNKIIGYSTPDTYETASYKILNFFKHFNLDGAFDYLFLCDDDTFVNPKRLENKIEELGSFQCYARVGLASDNPVLINNNKDYFPCAFPSGGAGFLINSEVFNLIKDYLIKHQYPLFLNGDVTIGAWFKDNGIIMLDGCDLLKAQNPDHVENLGISDYISQHYCNEEHFYKLYGGL